MFTLRGQPPCYQRAAWAAAGLREPPVATRNYTLADAMALHEAHRQGQAEGFVAGAAAEAEENRRRDEERDGAIRHLSLSTSPQSSVDTSSHHRTNSDTAPQISKAGEQRLNYKMIHVTRA